MYPKRSSKVKRPLIS